MKKIRILGTLCIGLALVGGCAYVIITHREAKSSTTVSIQTDATYVSWTTEIFDLITKNYWNTVKEDELANLYLLAIQKVSNATQTLPTKNKAGVAVLTGQLLAKISDAKAKRDFITNIAMVVLYNLAPAGRNGLLSQTQVKELRDTVANIDHSHDLYALLGVAKDAPTSTVETAYSVKKKELEATSSPDAKQKLQDLAYAHGVLTNETNKQTYDQSGVEPTVFPHILNSGVLYVYISKISPTTFNEFVKAIDDTASNKNLNSLIVDLRGNIGGAVDFVQYFMGLFIGPNQYAYDFFHQGTYTPYKTPIGKLASLIRFRNKIALLVDRQTQSSAELITASFKKFNVGIVIGPGTRGWGTIENTFPVTTPIDPAMNYALLLVHSLTIRDDNQPIEQNGVDPDIDTGSKNWKNSVANYFGNSALTAAIEASVASGVKK